ncbi:hypothetical protein AO260_34705 [Pseudomonas sp. ABAC21]|nr:hypothetical protein AO260_34705 [Pseudomonas sp. ABAC21]
MGEARVGQLARGVQIQRGMAGQLGRRQGCGADGEAEEQGGAMHGDGSRKQAVTVASERGQKPHNLMTGL